MDLSFSNLVLPAAAATLGLSALLMSAWCLTTVIRRRAPTAAPLPVDRTATRQPTPLFQNRPPTP